MTMRGEGMIMRTAAVLLFGAASALPAAAQTATPAPSEALTTSGSVRLRYEAIDGQPRAGFNDRDDFINIRTRLAAEYDGGAWRLGGEIFDSRIYDADPGAPVSTGEVNAFELVQAYLAGDFAAPWDETTKLTVQAGRYMLNLGSRRLVAADDYRNTTNGYTGLRLDAKTKAGAELTLVHVLPQVRLPDDFPSLADNEIAGDRESSNLQLTGGLATAPLGPKGAALQASYFRLDEDDAPDLPTRNRQLDTFGLRYFREPAAGAVDFDVEAFAQTGSVRASSASAAPSLDVWAWYGHAEAGYRWSGAWKPRLAAEVEYVSGDEPGGDFNRFDTLFGMRRAEIAPAGLYNAVGRANLISPGLRLEIEPSRTWDAFIGLRGLWLASETDAFSTTGVRDASGGSGDYAGTQIDARVRMWVKRDVLRFETNAVFLDKGSFLKTAPNANDPRDTLYVAFDLTALF
jgi:hypothetical protein